MEWETTMIELTELPAVIDSLRARIVAIRDSL